MKKELIFGEAVGRSRHQYHIIAGKTRSSIEVKINNEDGFLKVFPEAKYYPNGDENIKTPHIKFANKIILVCGHEKKDSWESLRGVQFGISMVYDFNLCSAEFLAELRFRSNDLCLSIAERSDGAEMVFINDFKED